MCFCLFVCTQWIQKPHIQSPLNFGNSLGVSPNFIPVNFHNLATIQKIIYECNFSMREYYFGIFIILECTKN